MLSLIKGHTSHKSVSFRRRSLLHKNLFAFQSAQSQSVTTVALREAPAQEKHGSNGLCPNSFSTPPPSSKRTLCGSYFRRKSVNFLKQQFRLWKWIFWQLLWSNFVLRCKSFPKLITRLFSDNFVFLKGYYRTFLFICRFPHARWYIFIIRGREYQRSLGYMAGI